MSALGELQHHIAAHCTGSVIKTAVPGLTLVRADAVMSSPIQTVYTPMICVVAQGSKQVTLADQLFEYDAAKYLISSVDLPVHGQIRNATPEHPYLALSLVIDPQLLSALLLEMPPQPRPAVVPRALAVTEITPELLEAFVRLLRLLDRPAEIPLLAPLVYREILYRLLTGEHGGMLRQIAHDGSRTQGVVRAINWIRTNYTRPFRMSDLTRVAGMSAASLHRHFKAVTAMSPLQYQKQIRLGEARRLLVSQQSDAAAAAFAVGYGSPSQFSREYGRQFGAPPRQDASRLRDAAEHAAAL